MNNNTKLWIRTLCVLIVLTAVSIPCSAALQIGIRGGYFIANGWSETHDLIYDSPGTYSIGAEFTYQFFIPLDLTLAVDVLSASGERVWPSEDGGFEPTGESVSYDMTPITLTARWHFLRESILSPYVGIGVGYVQFKESGEETIDGAGFLVQAGSDVYISRYFRFFFEAEYNSYPDTIGNFGASYYFDESDLGGIVARTGIRVVF